ncbi:GNAT family N-acetyltransferase [Ferrimonas balearica]|uniref:GNAT family N-acetyltransferase n=1 Tax=Ferrimonas balearica TaxID=44012 RepID=UPI001C9A2106|nr:N-acetyltransferase [Ferrimonas balearica]MBY5920747.1 N-acetyltransferase [Ferrimonas balearica]MBY5996568.1 N-acetyltransferase [Ferrimonas balearica]
MQISHYQAADPERIRGLFARAFSDAEGEAEGQSVGQLAFELVANQGNHDTFVFVAEQDGELAGAIVFTRLLPANDVSAFLLSPVAVRTDYQGKGVGQALIRYGLDALKAEGVEVAVTYGDPNFYGRVGFEPVSESVLPAPQPLNFPHGWLAQPLNAGTLPLMTGPVRCAAPLDKPEYW